jgi:hypothetical protein
LPAKHPPFQRLRWGQVPTGSFPFRRICHPQSHGIAARGSAHRLYGGSNR